MKKFIMGLLLCMAIGTQASAQTDTTRTRYYYYPSQHVYYNDVAGEYWYYDKPTARWSFTKTLPSTYVINDDTERYEVWYKGRDVWKDNAMHSKKYKVKTKGNKTKTKGE